MARHYDLVVIGTGVAASVAISRCRSAGWSVAAVDHRPFGGTCALRGCDPKKVLVGAAEAVDLPRRLRGKGVRDPGLEVAWPDLIAFKRGFTEPVPESRAKGFDEQGVDAFRGAARFTGANTLTVDGETLEGRYVLIAAGAEPMRLGIAGEEHLMTSDDFLELDTLPEDLVLVGGGFIAFELAHVARRAGARVTILEHGPRVLGPFDPDLVDWLVEKSRALGIDVRTDAGVDAVERADGGFVVHASGGDGARRFDAGGVVHAAGRVPALDALDLDAAGVARDGRRARLNEFLQSASNPAVYVAGDAAQAGPPLTPVSNHDGGVVAANMLEGNHVRPDYTGVPSVVFSIPPLASVGLGEHEAREAGLRFRVNCRRTSGWYTSRRVNEEAAGFKVLVDEDSGAILGAHLLGPHADELVNVFALAMRSGLTAADLKGAIFAYPTSASDLAHML